MHKVRYICLSIRDTSQHIKLRSCEERKKETLDRGNAHLLRRLRTRANAKFITKTHWKNDAYTRVIYYDKQIFFFLENFIFTREDHRSIRARI